MNLNITSVATRLNSFLSLNAETHFQKIGNHVVLAKQTALKAT